MRCESEALRLRWEDVDLNRRFTRVVSGRDGHRTKNGKTRLVPVTDRLLTAMRQHFADYGLAQSA
jgi:integrase